MCKKKNKTFFSDFIVILGLFCRSFVMLRGKKETFSCRLLVLLRGKLSLVVLLKGKRRLVLVALASAKKKKKILRKKRG